MLKKALCRGVVLVAVASCATTTALAGDIKGTWLRTDGAARVKMANCGASLCGTITWLRDPQAPGKVGQRVFFDMVSSGADTWAGSAFNPEDGNTYSGRMELSGDALTTTGCAMGGFICKSLTWSRIK